MQSYTFVVSPEIKEEDVTKVTKVDPTLFGYSGKELNDLERAGQKPLLKEVIQTSIDEQTLDIGCNSFIHSAERAYSRHHHLSIRPDDVWMAIITQFSFYLNANSETLRDKFVDFQGKKELTVQGGGTLFTANYTQLADMMSKEIANNITDPSIREWTMPSFTTTTASDKMVGAVALMASMKNYFHYTFSLRCGLPKVTLHGTVDDWKNIKSRAARLTEFELPAQSMMAKWAEMLDPVLDQFIATASHQPDVAWWNRIANHVGGGSGPTWISGWITVFAVFTEKGEWVGDKKETRSMRGQIKSEWPLVDTQKIPCGSLSCPVTVDDNGKLYSTELFAGHIGVKVINQTTLSPQLDWCLVLNPK
eukprot:gene12346-14478_t